MNTLTPILLLLAATLASIELTWATRILACFGGLGRIAQRAGRIVMRSPRSEWAKERAMRLVSMRMMGQSLKGAGLLCIVAYPFVLAVTIDAMWQVGLGRAYVDWPARLVLLGLSGLYWFVRRPRGKRANPRFERTWQRLALGHRAVLEVTFDMERGAYRPWPANDGEADAPVFVTGLARAGTTILTRALHEQLGLASLTYRDLPFPLAPNGWAALSARLGRHVEAAERGHGDGILHDLDSAEAIEEVFWRHHEGTRFASPGGLAPVAPLPETLDAFRDYVGLVRRRNGGARYLSKNNTNVLRLAALVETFPEAVLVHPFRTPLQQAQSLLRQHRLALELSAQDPFRAEFMGWLGHHEFGAGQKPFLFAGHPVATADRDHIDYWLALWISVHAALLDQPPAVRARQLFVDYDALCAGAAGQADRLVQALGHDDLVLRGLKPAPWRPVDGVNRRLMAQAQTLHIRLRARSLMAPGRPAGQAVHQSA
jgi:hypothetical protein